MPFNARRLEIESQSNNVALCMVNEPVVSRAIQHKVLEKFRFRQTNDVPYHFSSKYFDRLR